jgi:hypothetical protein
MAESGLAAESRSPHGNRPGECSGPSCSGRSGLPSTPPPIAFSRITQWAMIDAPPPEGAPAYSPGSRDDHDTWPNPSADAIFHPPRLTPLAR